MTARLPNSERKIGLAPVSHAEVGLIEAAQPEDRLTSEGHVTGLEELDWASVATSLGDSPHRPGTCLGNMAWLVSKLSIDKGELIEIGEQGPLKLISLRLVKWRYNRRPTDSSHPIIHKARQNPSKPARRAYHIIVDEDENISLSSVETPIPNLCKRAFLREDEDFQGLNSLLMQTP